MAGKQGRSARPDAALARAPEAELRVPLNDLQRHNAALTSELNEAMARVSASGYYILGPEVEAFESEFAAFCGVHFAVGVANGTDALELAVRALGIGPGDQVATVANAGAYSTTAILAAGAHPVYVDVQLDTACMDPAALERAITLRTRAVIVTHLYGRLAGMPALLEVTARAGIPVIEDCAQAHGAEQGGQRAGSFGALACFSFYPTKNLGALGDGGAVVTSREDLAERVRALRQYGWIQRFRADFSGGRNSRLDSLQAAFLRAKLPHVEGWNARRREIAAAYNRAFAPMGLGVPDLGPHHVAHLYVIRHGGRDDLREKLRASGVSCDVHYPVPDYRQPSLAGQPFANVRLPVTERLVSEILTLPCFPEITDKELSHVIASVRAALAA
jgi:dTDP-4-amino-4,6-dideoxygalactose transaminase